MAETDYFLKIEGIEGESTDHKHKNEIDLISWSWGETNSGSGATTGGRGAGKVAMQDLHVTMEANKASPKLMLACATGEHIGEATLVCRKAGGEQQEYLTIVFKDLLVSSYQTGGSHGDIIPIDTLSLNFGKIEFEFKPQKGDGSLDSPVKVGWDVMANHKI